MQRTVITPADLSGDALDEIKGWLGISRSQEDNLLLDLLGASVALCEAFTGQAPIEQIYEEWIPATRGQHGLNACPVKALISAEEVGIDNTRTTLAPDAFEFLIDASHKACFALERRLESPKVAVTIRAGIAPDWTSLPQGLKHGLIRMTAFHFRDREIERDAAPPASVAALWRPWRQLRLT